MKKLATLAIWLTSPPLLGKLLQAGDVGFRDFHVDVLREEQRDVDVDAFADGPAGMAGCLRQCQES